MPAARRTQTRDLTGESAIPLSKAAKSPNVRQRVILAVAAGALAAWLTLLAIIAFAT